jgi:putative sterol carrier protein
MESADTVTEFFTELDRRGHEPLLAKVRGTMRFELTEPDRIDRWLVALDKGTVSVSRNDGPADCVIRTDRTLFGRMCRGEENMLTAELRGAVVFIGEVRLLYAIQRIFPGPSRERQSSSSVRNA